MIGHKSGIGKGDLLIFRPELGETNVTSLVERRSRYTVINQEPQPALAVDHDKIINDFSPLPAFARQSFTFDRGTQFRGFRALEDTFGARGWFCDPSAPWQKGAVENTNQRPCLGILICPTSAKRLGYKTPVFHVHLHECG